MAKAPVMTYVRDLHVVARRCETKKRKKNTIGRDTGKPAAATVRSLSDCTREPTDIDRLMHGTQKISKRGSSSLHLPAALILVPFLHHFGPSFLVIFIVRAISWLAVA